MRLSFPRGQQQRRLQRAKERNSSAEGVAHLGNLHVRAGKIEALDAGEQCCSDVSKVNIRTDLTVFLRLIQCGGDMIFDIRTYSFK
jgi:hypothetical protein